MKHLQRDLFMQLLGNLLEVLPGEFDRRDVRDAIDTHRGEYGITDLIHTVSNLGFTPRSIKIRGENIHRELMPCLFIPKSGEPVVFGNVTDIPPGMRLHGIAWIFPKDAQAPLSLSIPFFTSMVQRFRPLTMHMLLASLLINVLALGSPLFIMLVYDRVFGAHGTDNLWPLLAGAALAVLGEYGLRSVRAKMLAWIASRLDYLVGSAVFERLLKLPPLFIERAPVAAQIARIRALDAIRDFFAGALFLAFAELPFVIITIGVLAIIAGSLVTVPLIALAAFAFIFVASASSIRAAMTQSAGASAGRQQMVIETFEKIDDLRLSGLGDIWLEKFRSQSAKAAFAAFRVSWVATFVEASGAFVYTVAGLATLVTGIEHVWAGTLTPGALIAAMFLTWRILMPVQVICNGLPRLEQLGTSISQVNRLMSMESEERTSAYTASAPRLRGFIQFNRVGLRYARDHDPVFTGFSLNVRPGQMVAITGVNGAGKSTVLKLANAMVRPQAGSVAIDDIDLRQFDPRHLRRMIAYVPQNPMLIGGTIAENLRLSDPSASDAALVQALTDVGAGPLIQSLDKGIDTTLHGIEDADTLGCFVNLARAYINPAPVVLIDELPYAFLNSPAGAMFLNTLAGWKGRRTILIVSHRADYIALADQAVLLRNGEPPVTGTPDNIMEIIYNDDRKRTATLAA